MLVPLFCRSASLRFLRQAERKADPDGDGEVEEEHAAVQRGVERRGPAVIDDVRHDGVRGERRKQQPKYTAGQTEQQSLRKQLPEHASRGGAQGMAHGEFAHASHRAHQQEAAHVDDSDQQHQCSHRHDGDQRCAQRVAVVRKS